MNRMMAISTPHEAAEVLRTPGVFGLRQMADGSQIGVRAHTTTAGFTVWHTLASGSHMQQLPCWTIDEAVRDFCRLTKQEVPDEFLEQTAPALLNPKYITETLLVASASDDPSTQDAAIARLLRQDAKSTSSTAKYVPARAAAVREHVAECRRKNQCSRHLEYDVLSLILALRYYEEQWRVDSTPRLTPCQQQFAEAWAERRDPHACLVAPEKAFLTYLSFRRSKPEPKPRLRPGDAGVKEIATSYAGMCRSCGTRVGVGARALWAKGYGLCCIKCSNDVRRLVVSPAPVGVVLGDDVEREAIAAEPSTAAPAEPARAYSSRDIDALLAHDAATSGEPELGVLGAVARRAALTSRLENYRFGVDAEQDQFTVDFARALFAALRLAEGRRATKEWAGRFEENFEDAWSSVGGQASYLQWLALEDYERVRVTLAKRA